MHLTSSNSIVRIGPRTAQASFADEADGSAGLFHRARYDFVRHGDYTTVEPVWNAFFTPSSQECKRDDHGSAAGREALGNDCSSHSERGETRRSPQ